MKLQAATSTLVAFWVGLAGSAFANLGDDPRDWLEQMATAMSQMSYQGTFVYVQGGEVESMRITHVSDDEGVRERLVSVSGPSREVLRDSNGVRWVVGGGQAVLEDQAFNRTFFPELPLDHHDQTNRSYALKFGNSQRIAGQTARNLKVLPRDIYRYGYSLWLEENSGLLLKWELIDSNRKSLAKLMFTDIRLGSEVDPNELKSSSQLTKLKRVESQLPAGRGGGQHSPRWKPGRLPPGFELTAHRFLGQNDQGIYEHLVYSDGLAAVSVYVESLKDEDERETGTSKLGTSHVFSRIMEDVLITVVGDVPAVTVEFIGNAVSPSSR